MWHESLLFIGSKQGNSPDQACWAKNTPLANDMTSLYPSHADVPADVNGRAKAEKLSMTSCDCGTSERLIAHHAAKCGAPQTLPACLTLKAAKAGTDSKYGCHSKLQEQCIASVPSAPGAQRLFAQPHSVGLNCSLRDCGLVQQVVQVSHGAGADRIKQI